MPINHLMEDAATAEIARVQLWQWVKYGVKTADGGAGKTVTVTPEYLEPIFRDEGAKVAKIPGIDAEHVRIAAEYMLQQVRAEWPSDFLTSDLMVHLPGVGTVGGGGATKAAL